MVPRSLIEDMTLGKWLQPPKKTKLDEREHLAIRMEKLKSHRIAGQALQRIDQNRPHLATPPKLYKEQLTWENYTSVPAAHHITEIDGRMNSSVSVPPRMRRKENAGSHVISPSTKKQLL